MTSTGVRVSRIKLFDENNFASLKVRIKSELECEGLNQYIDQQVLTLIRMMIGRKVTRRRRRSL